MADRLKRGLGVARAVLWVVFMAAMITKFTWNKMQDPPGTHRPCVFCSPYREYDPFRPSPPPAMPEPPTKLARS
jgi:hypothetical protein